MSTEQAALRVRDGEGRVHHSPSAMDLHNLLAELSFGAPFLVVDRQAPQHYIQVHLDLRIDGDEGRGYRIEYRDGGPERHFYAHIQDDTPWDCDCSPALERVVSAVQGWACNGEGWREALPWQPLLVPVDAGTDGYARRPSVVWADATPLHAAVQAGDFERVAQLLEQGADVEARMAGGVSGLTPLEYGLCDCFTIRLQAMANIACLLLGAGAARTPKARTFIRRLGEEFEFSRARIAAHVLEKAEDGLQALYELFAVTPVPRRQLHDGKALITVRAVTRRAQYNELWNLLVPASGPAATVQGEVIRIVTKLDREVFGNGGLNWDGDFEAMARALCRYLRAGTALPAAALDACDALIAEVLGSRGEEGDVWRMRPDATAWVLGNPVPMSLGKPEYRF